MASDQHLAVLKSGPQAWNKWRQAEPLVRPDLRGITLTLGEKQWSETNGGPINLARALLRDANLRHATLIRCNLSVAELDGADLSDARLQRADLRNASLVGARLAGADLADARLDGADLRGADLGGARNLTLEQLERALGDATTKLPQPFRMPQVWREGRARSAAENDEELLAPFPRESDARDVANAAKGGAGAGHQEPRDGAWRVSLWSGGGRGWVAPELNDGEGPAPEPGPISEPTETARSPGAAVAPDVVASSRNETGGEKPSVAGREGPAPVTRVVDEANVARWRAHLAPEPHPDDVGVDQIARNAGSAARQWPRARKHHWQGAAVALGVVVIVGLGAFTVWRWYPVGEAARPELSAGVGGAPGATPAEPETATLKKHVPASAEHTGGGEAEDAPQWLAIGEAKAPDTVQDLRTAEIVMPAADPDDKIGLLTADDEIAIAAIKPTNVKEAQEPANITVAAEPVGSETISARDARDGTRLAQATGLRTHGELPTPAGVTDRATPLVAPPQGPSSIASEPVRPVAVPSEPLPTDAPLRSAKRQKVPAAGGGAGAVAVGDKRAPLPKRKPAGAAPGQPQAMQQSASREPEHAKSDKQHLNFSGQDLSALNPQPKPAAGPPTSTAVTFMHAPRKSAKWIKTMIRDFYLSGAELGEAEIKQIYASPLEYFGEKGADVDKVAREKAEYYRHWPDRRYKLVPASLVVRWKSKDVADITFLYDFEVTAADNKRNKGRGRAYLTLQLNESGARIVREDGELVRDDE